MSDKRTTVWVAHFADRPALQLQWTDPATGKRRTRSAGTADRAEADRKRADLEYELNHGLHRDPSRLTWAAFRELFMREYVAGLRPQTRGNVSNALDSFERRAGVVSLRQVTERVLSGYVARMREDGLQASTMRVRLQVLKTALRWAHRQRLIPEVPSFPGVKVPRRRPRPVPAEAFERMIALAEGEMRPFLLACWLAGLRLSEAMALEWEPTEAAPWVDLDRRRIWFPASFAKSVEDEWVPLASELREALCALPRSGAQVFLLTSRTGGRICRSGMGTRIRELARRAGVRLNCHALRRGFICHHAARQPAQVVQALARHKNITTTAAFYVSVEAAAEEAILGPSVLAK